ncbi:MAG: hypothetical protein J6M02_04730 [Clostridia bacterium]|nr:hypothetical protein [Clostridia bacterium]
MIKTWDSINAVRTEMRRDSIHVEEKTWDSMNAVRTEMRRDSIYAVHRIVRKERSKMMKKFWMMAAVAGLLVCPCFATEMSDADITEILTCMNIVDGTETGTTLTRRDLAETLVRASKDAEYANVEIRITPFSDVSYDSENANHIRLAALNGYMTAYSDGQFRPDQLVKVQDAVTALLKLLGYTNQDFTQPYPYEQLAIADKIDLLDGVDVQIGAYVTQEQLNRLVYNALMCSPKGSSKKYVEELGYNVSGEDITLNDVMNKNALGPITYSYLDLEAGLGLVSPKVYINGTESTVTELQKYDVIYYSKSANIVWAYRDKVSGIVEEILPNKESPTSVTVSGKTYSLSSYTARKAFGLNGFSEGNMVTLLLDRNKAASDVYLTENLYSQQIGVIISAGQKEMIQSDGNRRVSYYATVLLADGEKIEVVTTTDYSKKIGNTALVKYSNGKATLSSTSKVTEISGTFDATNYTLGKYQLSSEVHILELDDFGNTKEIYPSRLDGVKIAKDSVALVEEDTNGIIEKMILKNVTGDTAKYGIITDIIEGKENDSYTCLIEGSSKNYSNSDITFNVEEGPAVAYFEGSSLESLKNLENVAGGIESVSPVSLTTLKGEKFLLAADVQVYRYKNSEYFMSNIDEAISGEYSVSAYYDKAEDEGGRVRMLILR